MNNNLPNVWAIKWLKAQASHTQLGTGGYSSPGGSWAAPYKA